MNADQGLEMGHMIVEDHGGKTGGQLAAALVAAHAPTLAGRLTGIQIVAAHGGRTGPELVEAMTDRFVAAAA